MDEKEVLEIIEEAARDGRTELDLNNKGIESLPAEIGNLTNLTELYLYNNQLTRVPKELGQLTKLTKLYMFRNQLTSVPEELGQLKNLTGLGLDINQLTSIPKELGQLKKLMLLDLDKNQLTSVPKEFGQLKNLVSLNISFNELTSIPKELGQLTKLEKLDLEGNPLVWPPPDVVEQGTKAVLEYLRTSEESTPKPKRKRKTIKTKTKKTDKDVLIEASIDGSSVSDQPEKIDSLGFKPYTTAIANFLSNENTKPPLTMSVEGEWGSGKTSFMIQLEEKLKAQGGLSVRFSPWRHDKEEALWAAFVLTFIDQLSSRGWFESIWQNCKLLWRRFDWCAGWLEVVRVVAKLSVYLLVLLFIIVVLLVTRIPYIENLNPLGKVLLSIIGTVTGGVLIVLKGLKKAREVVGNPFEHDLKKYIQAPDYAGRISFVERFHTDFHEIVKTYAGSKKVYIFIDDLDRCELPKAAELMKALNLMISNDPNLIFIIGMDRQKVAAGLAVKDKELIHYLRPQVVHKKNDEDKSSYWLDGLRYGYSFIEKFIQLPFGMPRPTHSDIDNMMASMRSKEGEEQTVPPLEEKAIKDKIDTSSDGKNLVDSKGKSEVKREEKIGPKDLEEEREAAEKQRQMELKLADDSEQICGIVHMIAPAMDFNPRRVKQFINLFRLKAYIAYETQLLILPEEIEVSEGVTLEQLGKIVAISLRWPLLLEALERDELLLGQLSEFAEGMMENSLSSVVARRWAQDEQLLELIRFGCMTEERKKTSEWPMYTLRHAKIDKLLRVSPKIRNMKKAPLEIKVSDTIGINDNVGEVIEKEREDEEKAGSEEKKKAVIRKKKKAKKKVTKKKAKVKPLRFQSGSEKYISPSLKGKVTFDYSNNNGNYIIGAGDLAFETHWSKADDTSINTYSDMPSIAGIGLALDVTDISEISDATRYDMSSRARTPEEGEIVVARNQNGYYAVMKVLDVKDRTREDDKDELTFEYVILSNRTADFMQ
jgi:Leucine-rich repeat (LRR) protein